MSAVSAGVKRPTGIFATERRDAWWVAPVIQGAALAMLITYANWAAFQGNNYQVGGYLSPLYSPLITWPGMSFSPAFLILLPPVLFRATCYYYRKAYYRSYFLDPPACAVGEAGADARGAATWSGVHAETHKPKKPKTVAPAANFLMDLQVYGLDLSAVATYCRRHPHYFESVNDLSKETYGYF